MAVECEAERNKRERMMSESDIVSCDCEVKCFSVFVEE